MEDELNRAIQNVYKRDPTAVAVMVVDDSGLCLACDNGIPEEAAGLFASIVTRAEAVLPPGASQSDDSAALVQIEAGQFAVVIKQAYGVTMGIVKDKTRAATP
ncbi:hypothetical protein IWQ56_002923 [Coemansia nantahalensis]|uniref:Uncharacterized protein n=2 Tax=Coemansia TaxID=4863 RepID=A0ACC1L6D4_9FUNG|nr:hypothetical protein IWQ56_002923 [Coemansia nantahalensis]KAJ2775526.1 hypothetical protein IWQ57_000390 [Coemansia nantahalensis]KAJ2801862.1 hypothetical protein H4R21_002635 [Coemansia helicoidea]